MHQVYFVRHGETVWNVENKICGATESPLTARGREQARAIGRELRARMDAGELKLDRMLCSPLSRARDTAEEIANILELPLAVDVRLREQNFGKWEGTARDGEGFQRAKENFIYSFSGGESMMRVAQRIYNLLDELREEKDTSYLLVAHNGISRIVESYFRDMENEEFASFGIRNAALRAYSFPEEG